MADLTNISMHMYKPILPYLETMATQICNLSCEGCTNYSDLYHKGYVRWESVERDIKEWLKIIEIQEFGIIGGEPLINPTIEEWIIGSRALFPNKQIMFITNGLLLHKHLHLIDLMHELGNFTLKITKHKSNDKLDEIINTKIINKYNWHSVFEYGINRISTDNNFKFYIGEPTMFTKSFVGDYKNMMPHNSNASDAFKMCCQKTCPLLYNGKIHKCSTAGLLKDVLKINDYPNFELWEDLIDYGIGVGDDISSIIQFINNFGKPNTICTQCPTSSDSDSILNHANTCTFK